MIRGISEDKMKGKKRDRDSRISMVLVLVFFYHFTVTSLQAINGSCDSISNVLKENFTTNLYGIEVGLKMLVQQELTDVSQELDEVPKIMHSFLSSKYVEAGSSLNTLIENLSLQINLTNSKPEATIDFSEHAMEQAKEAQSSIQQLIQCKENTITDHKQLFQPLESSGEKNDSCLVDGTKCQYLACAQGNKLPICAIGFGSGVTGGAAGVNYIVTRSDDADDPKNPTPGTIRFAIDLAGKNKGGVWITFKESMEIELKSKLWINSHTTIDGRGVNVTITGNGLVLRTVENVILHNFEIVSAGNTDAIHVFDGTQNVWIDHLTSRDAKSGLVTVIQGSTDVTISNCYLSNQDYIMLLGASDQDTVDQVLRVTVYRNLFESSTQRMPHCRWGYCHVVNNYYKNWSYYAIGARVHARVLSELNVFEAGSHLEVTPWYNQFNSDLTPTIVSSKDLFLKGATFHEFMKYGTLRATQDDYPAYKVPTVATNSLASLVSNCSGVLFGSKLDDCLASQ